MSDTGKTYIQPSESYVGIGNFIQEKWLRADAITEWIKTQEGYKEEQ